VLVIKLGGSLLGSPELPLWLDAIVEHGNGRVLIVPGGGVFADAVRQAQQQARFNDAVAHQLAVMAMDQYARVLTALNPALVTASTELEIAERSWQHRAIVWLPSHMVLADENIAQSWDVTSDSLAAWMAGRIKATGLLLVKSVMDASRIPASQWQEQQLVDAAFTQFTSNAGYRVMCMGKNESLRFPALLNGDQQLMS
jgi:aspartokinase-like uncharacterized kinase